MALESIRSMMCAGSLRAFIALALAVGSGACASRPPAPAPARAEAPRTELVAVARRVWVIGEVDAPEAYFTNGYYWRIDGDRWYRRTERDGRWRSIDARAVPERVLTHERAHHDAIIARRRPAAVPHIEAVRMQHREALERQAYEERAGRNALAARRQAARRRAQLAAREPQIALGSSREVGPTARSEAGSVQTPQLLQVPETAAEERQRPAVERQVEQLRRQREAQRRHAPKRR